MKYRKKPVIIEAEQFFKNKQPWPEGTCEAPCPCGCDADTFWIKTLEGHGHIDNGDWIITGVKGEKYPCKPDIFEQTYELAE